VTVASAANFALRRLEDRLDGHDDVEPGEFPQADIHAGEDASLRRRFLERRHVSAAEDVRAQLLWTQVLGKSGSGTVP
jgi:hypothetical protein